MAGAGDTAGAHGLGDGALSAWEQVLKASTERSVPQDSSLVVLGSSGVGLTAMLNRWRQFMARMSGELDVAALEPTVVSTLRYSYMNKAPAADGTDRGKLNIWTLCNLVHVDMLKHPLADSNLSTTVVMIALDASKPWTMKAQLDDWYSAVKTRVDAMRRAAYETSGSSSSSSSGSSRASSGSRVRTCLQEGRASRSLPSLKMQVLGLPLVVAVCKADQLGESGGAMTADQYAYLNFYLRSWCLDHHAALFCTSATVPYHCDELYTYVLHCSDSSIGFAGKEELGAISRLLIPVGSDSSSSVSDCINNKPNLRNAEFGTMFPTPASSSTADRETVSSIPNDSFLADVKKLSQQLAEARAAAQPFMTTSERIVASHAPPSGVSESKASTSSGSSRATTTAASTATAAASSAEAMSNEEIQGFYDALLSKPKTKRTGTRKASVAAVPAAASPAKPT